MPIALSKANATGVMKFGPDAMKWNAELMRLIGEIVARWGAIEAQLGIVLANMMRADTEIAMAMFLALESPSAKRDMLDGAASERFSGKELLLFQALRILAWRIYKERNLIAHTTWGSIDGLPDALLRVPHKALLKKEAAFSAVGFKHTHGIPIDPEKVFLNTELVMVYRAHDFQQICDRAEKIARHLEYFLTWLWIANDPVFQRLCNEPDVREVLVHLQKENPNQPESVPQ